MVRAVEWETPFLCVTAIAASPRLLSDEETNIVSKVVGCMKASRAHHAAIVQRAIPELILSCSMAERCSTLTCTENIFLLS